MDKLDFESLIPELEVTTSRSGGPGGQHVNKVETKVKLKLHIASSSALTPNQKEKIRSKLASKITKDGFLSIDASSYRSQLKNKQLALKKLEKLLITALAKPTPRAPTKPTKASIKKRLDSKKRHAEKKAMRKKPD